MAIRIAVLESDGTMELVPFDLGDRVHIDGDESIIAVVTCLLFNGCWLFEVSWANNGRFESATFPCRRLKIAPGEESEQEYPKLGVKQ